MPVLSRLPARAEPTSHNALLVVGPLLGTIGLTLTIIAAVILLLYCRRRQREQTISVTPFRKLASTAPLNISLPLPTRSDSLPTRQSAINIPPRRHSLPIGFLLSPPCNASKSLYAQPNTSFNTSSTTESTARPGMPSSAPSLPKMKSAMSLDLSRWTSKSSEASDHLQPPTPKRTISPHRVPVSRSVKRYEDDGTVRLQRSFGSLTLEYEHSSGSSLTTSSSGSSYRQVSGTSATPATSTSTLDKSSRYRLTSSLSYHQTGPTGSEEEKKTNTWPPKTSSASSKEPQFATAFHHIMIPVSPPLGREPESLTPTDSKTSYSQSLPHCGSLDRISFALRLSNRLTSTSHRALRKELGEVRLGYVKTSQVVGPARASLWVAGPDSSMFKQEEWRVETTDESTDGLFTTFDPWTYQGNAESTLAPAPAKSPTLSADATFAKSPTQCSVAASFHSGVPSEVISEGFCEVLNAFPIPGGPTSSKSPQIGSVAPRLKLRPLSLLTLLAEEEGQLESGSAIKSEQPRHPSIPSLPRSPPAAYKSNELTTSNSTEELIRELHLSHIVSPDFAVTTRESFIRYGGVKGEERSSRFYSRMLGRAEAY